MSCGPFVVNTGTEKKNVFSAFFTIFKPKNVSPEKCGPCCCIGM